MDINYNDMWPRYYFFLNYAQEEVVTWLKKREQFISNNWDKLE